MSRLSLYDRVADETASVVIRRYSTSFGMASRLLGRGVRQHVENIYALVRVADEIVDGGAAEAGASPEVAARLLDALEAETAAAIEAGYSANLVVHAFARSARWSGFGAELTAPFFASMRMDLERAEHDQASFERYVYGSAEVVGLMCLRAFLRDEPDAETRYTTLTPGARALGSAFQKVNFLRDLAADFRELGRSYFPGIRVDAFTEADKLRLLAEIDGELELAAATIPQLPASSRRAVALAQGLFQELSTRIRATPAERLIEARVRVPDPVKLRILARAATGRVA
ncbi:phytoene/squalene synthase family protein [Homoserinibacter sp. YIM 151385]|uniref:phytoene/squalene synthase family protein n=1 Tax=Homoserinibacter sp. YIM 151385 TaxID=2985506 RepID=UPI0022EFE81D|nr:squalene/phytoene synthase family protein [Homoserinibacter sp. YIM 151385]WBU37299.1 squalene/phytoene synthase family protein [Homoserinibacter sp. YIM 151385]